MNKLSDLYALGVISALVVFVAPWTASWARLPLQLKVSEGLALSLVYFWTFRVIIKERIYLPPGSLPMLGVIGISLLSFLWSPPPFTSEFPWAHGIYQPPFYNLSVLARQVLCFLFYITIVNVCWQRHLIILLLKSYILGGAIAALFGIGQMTFFLLGKSVIGVYSVPWDPVPRVLGTFNEPGPFSTFLATVFVLLMAAILFKLKLFKKIVLYGLWVVVGMALILTFSSRGLIEVIIGMAYLFLITFKGNLKIMVRMLFVFSLVVIILIILTIAYPQVFMGLEWAFGKITAEWHLDPSEAYTGGRKAGLYIAPRMFLHNPLFGIGFGNYPFLRNEFAEGIPTVSHLDLPGNVFLEFLAETGIVGFFAFLCLVASIFLYVLKGYQSVKYSSESLGIFHGLVAACLGISIDLMISSSLYFVYVWVLPGLLVAFVHVNKIASSRGIMLSLKEVQNGLHKIQIE